MEGQTYVQYTGIGGLNLNTGIMPMSIGGSSKEVETGTGGPIPLGFTIYWQFPGGIQLKGNEDPQGAWGYILGMENQDTPYADSDFYDYLVNVEKLQIGEAPTYAVEPAYEQEVRDTINRLVAQYARRVQQNAGTGDYSWDRFNDHYKGCLVW